MSLPRRLVCVYLISFRGQLVILKRFWYTPYHMGNAGMLQCCNRDFVHFVEDLNLPIHCSPDPPPPPPPTTTATLLLVLTVTPRVHDKVVGIMVQTKLDITTVNKGG